jgi:hypothetical protein
MLLKAVLDTETDNERINERLRSGAPGGTGTIARLQELLQPEAFTSSVRTASARSSPSSTWQIRRNYGDY